MGRGLRKFGRDRKNRGMVPFALSVAVIVSFFIFYLIVTASINSVVKAMLAIAVLLATGHVIRAMTRADGLNGLIMVRLKEGFGLVGWMTAVVGKYWNVLCDIGLVLSFGVLSGFAFRHLKPRQIVLSLFLLAVFNLIVLPYLPTITMMLIDVPPLSTETATTDSYSLTLAAIFLLGFVGLVVISILGSGAKILLAVAQFLLGNPTALQSAAPGVSLVIPGITLPLMEGIITIAIFMVVHEGGHGIAARLAKIRIKSTGIITAGWLPIGAFVDVDEKQLDKSKEKENARVSVAGSTGNLIACFLFFIPTIFLLSALPAYYDSRVVVIGVSEQLAQLGFENGMQILAVNGVTVDSLKSFAAATQNISANQTIAVLTDKGEFKATAGTDGKVGVIVTQPIRGEYWYVKSLFAILGLTTVLNFLVGIINLLPLPAFDGYRLFRIGVRNDRIVTAIMWVIIAAFLLNILPWLWR